MSRKVRKYSERNAKNGLGKNKKMNDDVYALRRRAINFLYEAKDMGFKLPRVTIRVTDDPTKSNHSGIAQLNQAIVWIPERTFKWNDDVLREVVLHEVVHAITGFMHDSKCPLMSATHDPSKPLSKEVVYKCFGKYFTTS